MRFFHQLLATGFGTGYTPIAPGTAGAALATAIYYFFYQNYYLLFTGDYFQIYLLIATLIFLVLGAISSNYMEQEIGEDPSCVVVDEMVGIWVSLLFVPVQVWWHILLAFILFRFFDIAKPLGIRQIDQKIKGGWGIMLDDVLAGVYANILLQIIVRV